MLLSSRILTITKTKTKCSFLSISKRAFSTVIVPGTKDLKNTAPKLPIVLAHGLLGFEKIGPLYYFRDIKKALEGLGCEVYVTIVHPTESIENRAKLLKKQLDAIYMKTKKKIHLIAHSMGGLDSRFMITRLGGDEIVQSLTTLSTPHHGSSLADWGTDLFGKKLYIENIMKFAKIPYDSFYQLTPKYLTEEFNPNIKDVTGVDYFSWSARKSNMPLWNPLYYFWSKLHKLEGENDGLVSVESAQWGNWRGTVLCDHLELINWTFSFDTPGIYVGVSKFLRKYEDDNNIEK